MTAARPALWGDPPKNAQPATTGERHEPASSQRGARLTGVAVRRCERSRRGRPASVLRRHALGAVGDWGARASEPVQERAPIDSAAGCKNLRCSARAGRAPPLPRR